MIGRQQYDKQLALAEKGDSQAQYIVGMYCKENRDTQAARNWLQKSADQKNPAAQYELANLLVNDNYYYGSRSEIFVKALNLVKAAAKQEHKESVAALQPGGSLYEVFNKEIRSYSGDRAKGELAYLLGRMHIEGDALPKNERLGMELYEIASRNNYHLASNALGCLYFHGRIVSVDRRRALDYFETAYRDNRREGLYAANIGLCYKEEKNIDQAERYYKESDGLGYKEASYSLAVIYQEKYRAEQSAYTKNDYKDKAIRYFQKAYESGNNSALKALCDFYQEIKEINEGIRYFDTQWRRAQNKPEPLLFLAELRNKSNDVAQVAACYAEATRLGNIEATYQLGCLYEAGKGTAKDVSLAFKHIYTAFEKGHAEAKKKLEDANTEVGKYYLLYQATKVEGESWEITFGKMQPYFLLEKTLGYSFKKMEHLFSALNRTIGEEAKEAPFQALEFVGDGVLSAAIRRYLFDKKPVGWTVDNLHKATKAMVGNQLILPTLAKKLGLQHLLRLDKSEAAHAITDNMLADAMEALIGAIAIESGSDVAEKVVIGLWKPYLEDVLRPAPQQRAAAPIASVVEERKEARAPAASAFAPSPAHAQKPLTPRTQRVFSALGGDQATTDQLESYLQKAPHAVNSHNIGKKGDTPLMTILRSRIQKNKGQPLRVEKEVPKIKVLLKYGALWEKENHKKETAQSLLQSFSEADRQRVLPR